MIVFEPLQKKLVGNFTSSTLTLLIIMVALLMIYLALTVKSPMVKAGLLLYEILP